MSIQQLRQLFAMESQDTLQQMEDAILLLEKNADDLDAIKLLFRSAHTIKGSAGVVGLEKVSAFTHTMENVLERVRNRKLKTAPELIVLMLECHDHIRTMMDDALDGGDGDTPELQSAGQALQERLKVYLQRADEEEAAPSSPPPQTQAADTAQPRGETAESVPSSSASDNEQPDLSVPEPEENPESEEEPTGSPASAASQPSEVARSEMSSGRNRLRERFVRESAHDIDSMQKLIQQACQPETARAAFTELLEMSGRLANSAAVVEFMPVSEFAQMMVNVFKKLLSGIIQPEAGFSKLGTACINHLADLIQQVDLRGSDLEDEVRQTTQTLLEKLRTYLDAAAKAETGPKGGVPAHKPTLVEEVDQAEETKAAADNWHISLRFMEDALRNGIEPLASLRYLSSHGNIISLYTIFDTMPNAEVMNPDACYLGFEIDYKTEEDKESIEAMFELVAEHCRIRILPPHSKLSHYIRLLEELPEDTLRLGEILIKIGTLTDRELHNGLEQQNFKLLGTGDEENADHVPIGEILVGSGVVQQDLVDAALDKQRQSKEGKGAAPSKVQKTLNVDAEKLDQLINLVGELVIANASVNLLMQEVSHDRLRDAASLMSRLVEDIRNSTLRMRMVHIGGTFNRFRRLVHDLSRDLGKQIDLVITGAEAELDKSMVEKINDPLMHLLRNAIDHGIEPPEERVARGKPATGTVSLNAYHDSGSIVIEVSDDGKGLNRQKILATAIQRGLVKAGQDITEDEVDNLIFESSLSTAGAVTQLSGRGVGLDVVKRNINALNGMVDVHSEEGQGSTFQIFLPLTLAIIDGFLLNVGSSAFVVPLDRVVECVEFSEQEQEITQTGYLNLRGKVLPLVHVHRLFGIPRQENTRANIIVVRYGNQEAGLMVDNLLGEFQAVIKPLGKIFEKLSGVSGATILGNGEVALILDIPGLVQKFASGTASERERHHFIRDTVSMAEA